MRRKLMVISSIALILWMAIKFSVPWHCLYAVPKLTSENIKPALIKVEKKMHRNNQYQCEVNQKIEDLQQQMSQLDLQVEQELEIVEALETKNSKSKEACQVSDAVLEQKEDKLNKRLRAMYKMNLFSFCELFLNADSLEDGFQRLDMLQRIYEQDMRQVESLKDAKRKRIEQQRIYQQAKYNNLKGAAQLRETKNQLSELLMLSYTYQKKLMTDQAALEEQEDALLETSKQIEGVLSGYNSNYTYFGSKLKWPVIGHYKLSSVYGMRKHPILNKFKMHTGIDVATPFDAPVTAAEDGEVILACWYGSYGKTIMVDHGSGHVTLYAHNNALVAKEGDMVKRGQVLALTGSTGNSTGPHIHFEVRINGKPVNPLPWVTK